jgi:hypothetical protein
MAEEPLPQTPPPYALLVGLSAFAGWMTFRSIVPRRMGWVNWLGGVGILALFFSIASPNNDAFQQELIRPTPSSATVSSHTKVAQRGSLVDLSINAFQAAGDPIRALTGRSVCHGSAFGPPDPLPGSNLDPFPAHCFIMSLRSQFYFLVSAVSVLCLFGGISHCKSRTPPFLMRSLP